MYINGDGDTSRDFCYIENAIQANILSAVAGDSAKDKVFNVAVGDRTSLIQLYKIIRNNLIDFIPELEITKPVYRDFRVGDVRHSCADIDKAKNLIGYQPTHKVLDGVGETVKWCVDTTF